MIDPAMLGEVRDLLTGVLGFPPDVDIDGNAIVAGFFDPVTGERRELRHDVIPGEGFMQLVRLAAGLDRRLEEGRDILRANEAAAREALA